MHLLFLFERANALEIWHLGKFEGGNFGGRTEILRNSKFDPQNDVILPQYQKGSKPG